MEPIRIIAAVCVIIGILLLGRIVNILPSLLGCLLRWKECLNLEDSVRLSSDRNVFAVFMAVPLCLVAARYRLYAPDFMTGGLSPEAYAACVAGVFILYCLLRLAMKGILRKPRMPEKIYKAACRSSLSFFCLSVTAVLIEAGICSFADVSADITRLVLLYSLLGVYLVAITRKFQIFRNYCSFLTAFLYLCVLEFLPTGILVISAALF